MRRLHRYLLLGVLTIATLGAGWYFTRPKPIAVALATVDRRLVERTVSNTRAATVTACRRSRLAPKSGGQIARLLVHEGDRVKAGQVLLELWNKDLVANERLTQDQLRAARLRAQEACLSADLAERDAERSRQLKEKGFHQ